MRSIRRGWWLVVATVALALVIPSTALARGSVKIANRSPTEANGRWKLKFTIDYGGKPHIGHIPMVFEFKPTMYYERSLTDESPDKPILRRVPLQNQTPITLSMDVGFADMRGEIFKITKFGFKLGRANDFKAGEYTLKVRLASGGTIGRPLKIILKGDNPIINRKSMIFHTDKPKKKKPKAEVAERPEKTSTMDDLSPQLDDIPDDPDAVDEAPGPPEVEPKRGGGCAIATRGKPDHRSMAWLLLGLGGLMAARARP